MGFLGKLLNRKRILIHTVSVGEFLGALPLINALKSQYPAYEITVSTTTLTGHRIAKLKLGSASKVVFFPLDFRWAVKRFLNRLNPSMIILMETEIWPNFLDIAGHCRIPVVMINGRISERSFRNYLRIKRFFTNACRSIRLWGVQFRDDKNRLAALGIDKEKIYISGSLKIDSAVQNVPDEEDVDKIRREWGWKEDMPIIAGGSTHGGEEKILLDIYCNLKDNFRNMVLILAPRHPERTAQLKKLIGRYKLRYVLRSEWKKGCRLADYDVVLVDTLGELFAIYTMARVVFIGKSLTRGGGQNILEPAALGKPVICGPLMGNFRDITGWLLRNKGIFQVKDKSELQQTIEYLLNNKKEASNTGDRARELIFRATGAVERDMILVNKIFKG